VSLTGPESLGLDRALGQAGYPWSEKAKAWSGSHVNARPETGFLSPRPKRDVKGIQPPRGRPAVSVWVCAS
jgi:hypothetical protein